MESDGTGTGIARDLDAAILLDNIGKIALEDLPCLGEGHRWRGAELFLGPFSITPLLCHPSGSDPLRHWLENEDQAASPATFAIGQVPLLATALHALQRLPDGCIGRLGIAFSPSRQLGSVQEKGIGARDLGPSATASTAPSQSGTSRKSEKQ